MARIKMVIQVACEVVQKKGITTVVPPKYRAERVTMRGLSESAARELADLVVLHGGESIRLRKKSTKHLSAKAKATWDADNTPPEVSDDAGRPRHYSVDEGKTTACSPLALNSSELWTNEAENITCPQCIDAHLKAAVERDRTRPKKKDPVHH